MSTQTGAAKFTGRGRSSASVLAADQAPESAIVADRIEVGVALCHVATAVPQVDRAADVLDGMSAVRAPCRPVVSRQLPGVRPALEDPDDRGGGRAR